MGYYTGKKLLIIGGTGTIGNGLLKELLKQEPEVVRIFSRDEYKQFQMENEYNNKKKLRFLIGDVRDYERVEKAMEGIDIVFNLAAMKHVPSCEYNPFEAIKTNVLGMENVIKAAMFNDVDSVLFTSSDKAINPTNSYGATKLLAEKLVQAANFSKGESRTKFVAVRFGNVMGSRGSALPLFINQIQQNRRITVTDPEMTRFMMTIKQAVELIMEVVEKAVGGEVFVLKMPVIKLRDFAEVIIEETCKKFIINREEVSLQTIGLRAGERKFEELMTQVESEYAFDLGNRFAVLPAINIDSLYKFYKNYKKVENISYNSSDINILSKEAVRALLLNTGLV
jgi:FlaA1/EpsC-like NDP-sugar epimerase